MTISDRARKLLWGRSGNRCAICRQLIVMDATGADREAIVGDECHIVAREPGGPRAGQIVAELLDEYENLLLLCKVHHKQVDDQPNTFTSDQLRHFKSAHEQWVRLTLQAGAQSGDVDATGTLADLFGQQGGEASHAKSNAEIAHELLARAQQRRGREAWYRSEEALRAARHEVNALCAYLEQQVKTIAGSSPELGLEFEMSPGQHGCVVRTARTSFLLDWHDGESASLVNSALIVAEYVGAFRFGAYGGNVQGPTRLKYEQYSFTQTRDGLPGWHVASQPDTHFETSLQLADSYVRHLLERATDHPGNEHLW